MNKDDENIPTENEKVLANNIMVQSQMLEQYNQQVKLKYPTNYLQKMQPYVNLIIVCKKKHKIKNHIEAALLLSQESKNAGDKIMFLASAVEMLKNEK